MNDQESAALLEAVDRGDRDALQALIVDHHATLRAGVAAAIRPEISRRIDADDVLQQTYIAAFKALSDGKREQAVDPRSSCGDPQTAGRDPQCCDRALHRPESDDQDRDREGAADPSPVPRETERLLPEPSLFSGGTTGGLDNSFSLQGETAEGADRAGECLVPDAVPPRFDGLSHFHKWLERIALNQLSNMVRDLKRQKRDYRREIAPPADARTSYPRLAEHLAATESTPSRKLAREEAVAAVMSSLARLGEVQREVIRLRFIEARPVPEVAAALGKTDAAIHALCYRGLKELKRSLASATPFRSRR